MAIGTCKFVRQIGGRGSYAFVRVEVTPGDTPAEIDASAVAAVPQEFVASAKAGILYAWEMARRQHAVPQHCQVKIVEVKHTTVDSTSIMVYVRGRDGVLRRP